MISRKNSILRTAASSVLLRIVSLACTLAQVPIVMPYLGKEYFGFWMVLVAIGGFFGLSDLGISSAFQNDVTLADTRGERAKLRPMFLTAQATLLVMGLAGAAILIIVVATLGRATFFRDLSPDLAGQAVFSTAVFVLAGACNMPLALSGRLAFGLHEGRIANITALVAQILTLGAMIALARLHAPFAVFLLVSTVPMVCGNFALGVWLFRRLPPSEGKKWEGMAYAKHAIRSGFSFFALGASQPFFFAMGPLLLSSAFGPSVVTAYALAARALGVLHNVEAGILGATWPALTEAFAHSNYEWARRCMRRNVLLTCAAFCLPSLLFPLLGPPILALWSGLPVASFPPWIIWPVTLLFCCVLFQGPFYIALSAAGAVGTLALSHFAAAALALVAAMFWHEWPMLIPTWIALAFALCAVIPPVASTLRLLRPRAAI